jgi:hypothetical protein
MCGQVQGHVLVPVLAIAAQIPSDEVGSGSPHRAAY